MIRALTAFFLFFGLILAFGCVSTGFRVGSSWDPKEARFFDDGVDMVKDLSSLSGKWGYEQENDLDGRVQLADLVAEVEILSVQTLSDIDGYVETAKRIEVAIVKKMYGNAPSNKFSLVSAKEAPGHEFLLRYERHLNGNFLLFVRWYEDEEGSPSHHFHFSPASDKMKPEVEKRVSRRMTEEAAEAAKK
ncbi:MAG: hypothetical protein GY847_40255 [Proteobacteria bacterium]|nr:hypothetical protein [Pseudomonadota bacterium]